MKRDDVAFGAEGLSAIIVAGYNFYPCSTVMRGFRFAPTNNREYASSTVMSGLKTPTGGAASPPVFSCIDRRR
ncbi:hypothetical protein D3OALGA1CA_4973 [Olavius algarvensis associated proteobacterium Delta 3]|nr:hypothetical protein D3OALGA1CA_4973 [Olavius algarvensis associated proteobacterium Delta 3]